MVCSFDRIRALFILKVVIACSSGEFAEWDYLLDKLRGRIMPNMSRTRDVFDTRQVHFEPDAKYVIGIFISIDV